MVRETPSIKKMIRDILIVIHLFTWVAWLGAKMNYYNLISRSDSIKTILVTLFLLGVFYLYYYVKNSIENTNNCDDKK